MVVELLYPNRGIGPDQSERRQARDGSRQEERSGIEFRLSNVAPPKRREDEESETVKFLLEAR